MLRARPSRSPGRIAAGPARDIVCVEYVSLAPLLPDRRRGVWTLTLHNLVSEMARHNAALAPGRRQRMMLALEERNARRIEHRALRGYDLVVTPSPEDAARLPTHVAVVPNGVDLDRFQTSPVPAGTGVVEAQSAAGRTTAAVRYTLRRCRSPEASGAVRPAGARPPVQRRTTHGPDGPAAQVQ